MKKTVSVNIRGLNFIIEEDAYELLQDYLDRLNSALKNESGNREILEDVELRIAEICSAKLSDNKTVIELKDIEEIIEKMGDPSDYVDEDIQDNEESKEESASSSNGKSEKRLFRDTDNAVIAGVCSGIANFFSIDVVIIRAIFVIMFLFGGFGFPLYLILWVIVPKVKSSIDRLRMKGKPITVDSVRKEVENAAENISKGSKRFARNLKNDDTYGRSISRGARILASILGIGLIFMGISFLIPFLIFIIGGFDFIPVQNQDGFISFTEFGSLVLTNNRDFSMMWIGGLLVGFSIAIFLLLLGSMLIFRIKNKWAKLSLLFLFLCGVAGGIMTASAGMNTGKDFFKGAEIEKEVAVIDTDVLNIIPNLKKLESDPNVSIMSNDDIGLIEIEDDNVRLYGVHFEYVPSSDSLFHVYQNITARGRSHAVGLKRCQNIKHNVAVQGDSILVDTDYAFPTKDKLRDQEVYMIIEVPEGKQVRFNDRLVEVGGRRGYEIEGYLEGDGEYDHDD